MHGISQPVSSVCVIPLMCKLSSCSNHSAFFDKKNTVGFFLYNNTFSKIHYKEEIYSNKLPLMHSQNSLQPKWAVKL
jgi:hypothetical protein